MKNESQGRKAAALLAMCTAVFLAGGSIFAVKENREKFSEIRLAEITEAEAEAIAVNYVGGSEKSDITECRKYRSGGKNKYYTELYYKDRRYEFRIDAQTGEVLNRNYTK